MKKTKSSKMVQKSDLVAENSSVMKNEKSIMNYFISCSCGDLYQNDNSKSNVSSIPVNAVGFRNSLI